MQQLSLSLSLSLSQNIITGVYSLSINRAEIKKIILPPPYCISPTPSTLYSIYTVEVGGWQYTFSMLGISIAGLIPCCIDKTNRLHVNLSRQQINITRPQISLRGICLWICVKMINMLNTGICKIYYTLFFQSTDAEISKNLNTYAISIPTFKSYWTIGSPM